jgi:hypothetical protein
MAKKVVATLKDKTTLKKNVKCIKMVKSPKTGAYSFKEEILENEEVKGFFASK